MKRLAAVVIATAVLFAATALAVAQGDRELFVPPPDSVAEGYIREIVTKRWARAQAYRQEPAPESHLQALQQRIEAAAGEPATIEAETIERDEKHALVTVRLSSGKGWAVVHCELDFAEEWQVVTP